MIKYKAYCFVIILLFCSCANSKKIDDIPLEQRGIFKLSVPAGWMRDNNHEQDTNNVFVIKHENLRKHTFCRVMVMRLYTIEKPIGVNSLEDWINLHYEESYKSKGIIKEFIKPFSSKNIKGIHLRTRNLLDAEFDLIQDQYTFSKFFENNQLKCMWHLIVQSTEKIDKEIANDIDQIVKSFEVLSYKWE